VAEILRDDQRHPAIKIQQLVLQSRARLKQGGASVPSEALDRADDAMVDAILRPHVAPWINQPGAEAEPRVACDLSAFELALGDQSWRQEYRLLSQGATPVATRTACAVPSQRYGVDRPGPPGRVLQVAALAYPLSTGVKTQLQLRCDVEDVCHAQTHPRIELRHAAGVEVFAGERQLRWPLHRLSTPPASPTLSEIALLRQPEPAYVQVSAETCGLRLAGAPIGRQEALVTVWPAEQWLAEFRAQPQPEWDWPVQGGHTHAPLPAMSLACDGNPLPVQAWLDGWTRLVPALQAGVERWWQNLQRNAAIDKPRIHLVPGLMHGTSSWTWGMRESVGPEGSSGFLRVQAEGGLVACGSDLTVTGELSHEGAVGRLRLRSAGEARLETRLLREQPEPALAPLLAQAKVTWRHPFEAELDVLSTPKLTTLSLDPAHALGALSGEAGLRPRPDGQGFQWYCVLRLEPMQLVYTLWDPMRGLQRCTRELWPATPLLDWSAG
jgi:hypothetical protein